MIQNQNESSEAGHNRSIDTNLMDFSMIKKSLSFGLPLPWIGKKFETKHIGFINFLVGPNGSGKSNFAMELRQHLGTEARLLATDRLSGMEQIRHPTIRGDGFDQGFPKHSFVNIKNAGQQGSGIDSIVLLAERMDLRIQVEATIGDLFNRKISLEWKSGNLIARVIIEGTDHSYRLDRDECHGIKELVVLLTHLYNDEHQYLIIDEPELNLHPQLQAFFMQEVRKLAGDPTSDSRKKILFLITHSPFILDFRSVQDLHSVISFDLDYSVPKQILGIDLEETQRWSSLVPRLNVNHKQLFFSDNPVFVEGILDSLLIAAMQESRGVSVAGAGSCIIDVGGCEEVNHYLELCMAFGKKAYFLYDLDSLFMGNLRGCVKEDGSIQHFLATVGVANDFSRYCGELDRKLTNIIDKLLSVASVPSALAPQVDLLKNEGPRGQWVPHFLDRARVLILTAINIDRETILSVVPKTDLVEIEGRLNQIVTALKQKNIILLPGGSLEQYLPSYAGDRYNLTDEAKRRAVFAEIDEMKGMTAKELPTRYGELYTAVCALPSRANVDLDPVLRDYLSHYILDLQLAIVNNPVWELEQVQGHMNIKHPDRY